jgi:DNA-binding winged helix-turn-helix (wHTH) protein
LQHGVQQHTLFTNKGFAGLVFGALKVGTVSPAGMATSTLNGLPPRSISYFSRSPAFRVERARATFEVSVAGTPVHLTGKEYAILEMLSLRKGMTLTKEMFLTHLYGGRDEPELKIIDVFVCKLRKKLHQAGAPSSGCIETVWGRGYVMRDPQQTPLRAPIPAPAPAAATFVAA